MLGLGHLEKVMAYADDGVAEDDLLHRLVGRYPRPASQCKPIADVDSHTQAEGIGLRQRTIHHPPEVLTQRIGLAFVFWALGSTTNGHQITASQSHILHRLQVSLDTLLADSTIHPIPEGPRLLRVSVADTK